MAFAQSRLSGGALDWLRPFLTATMTSGTVYSTRHRDNNFIFRGEFNGFNLDIFDIEGYLETVHGNSSPRYVDI
jgi:hypothetical protein